MDMSAVIQTESNQASSLPFCFDALRKTSWFYICWLVLAGVLSYVTFSITRGSPLSSVRPSLLIYFMVLGVHLVVRLTKNGKVNILGPDMLFLVFYTMFHLGYVILYAIGILPYNNPPFYYDSSIPKSLYIINLGEVSFLIGFEILGGRWGDQANLGRINMPRVNWCIFGLACMAVAVCAHLVVLPLMAPQFMVYGYRVLQGIDKYTGNFFIVLLWRYSLQLMILGIVVYSVSSGLRYGKLFKSKLAMGLCVVYYVLVILEGDRGPLVQLGAPLLLVRHYFVKPIKIRHLFVLTISVLILFTAMAVVRTIVFQPAKMLQEYQYHKESGTVTWMNPFIEMGGTFLTVNITCQDVPTLEPYWLGASWRDAIIHIVPFLQGFTSRLGVSIWAPSTWLTTTYFGSNAAGRAYTVAAEGYLNFGYPGVIIELSFLGLFLRWLTIKFSRNPSAMWGVIMLGCTGLIVLTVRNHVGILFAACARIIVVAFLLNLFLKNEPVYEYETEQYDELPQDETTHV